MKKVVNVYPFVDSNGTRAIEITYDNGKKIIPFSEKTLMKYKKIYENGGYNYPTLIENIKTNLDTTKIDINMDKFVDYITNDKNRNMIVRRIRFIVTAIGLAKIILMLHHNFYNDLPNPILPEEDKVIESNINTFEYLDEDIPKTK